ncbi:hypothetical protein RDI58_022668 [Solanum bulbocastanum]|uniref:Reverse transcriptase zinc-binding domain-containing protein n=1 Tax=Solanum bulbocastanum TaxID=147425 RepID=A0AAN8T657_SOLBU
MKVANLIINGSLNLDNCSFPIPTNLADPIYQISLDTHSGLDFPIWTLNSNGLFTTTSLRKMLQPTDPNNYTFQWIWDLKTLNKIKYFLWQCFHNRNPSELYLQTLNISNDNIYPICNINPESLSHILIHCPIAKQFWESYQIIFDTDFNTYDNCLLVIKNKNKNLIMQNPLIQWKIFFPFAIWYV